MAFIELYGRQWDSLFLPKLIVMYEAELTPREHVVSRLEGT